MNERVGSNPEGYSFRGAEPEHTHRYLWDPVKKIIGENQFARVFDLGCGNGALAFDLSSRGISVTGVDPSDDGIRFAQQKKQDLGSGPVICLGNAYDDQASRFGTFPCLVSLEVVEHVYFPRKFAKCVCDLLEPRGLAIISTPYHSYAKNLALAISGKMDQHFSALWDHGHIKFWSVESLTRLFAEQGLRREKVIRVGRMPMFAKSMILTFRKS